MAVTYCDGVLTQIPWPERFAIRYHKLIVADRRCDGPSSLTAVKDRLQAEYLINVMAANWPDDLREAVEGTFSRGRRWRERIEVSVQREPGNQPTTGPLL